MSKQNLHALIRKLEKKKWLLNRGHLTAIRKMKAGINIRFTPDYYIKKKDELDKEIHKLKLQR